MTDNTANGMTPSRLKGPSVEYRIYFAIIFLFSLPWALITWAFGLTAPGSPDEGKGFIARAWSRAAIITPIIFSA
ncbi:MAG: cytochrome PufQ [Pseudomonadota bacterium]